MDSPVTVGSSLVSTWSFFGEVIFKWIPATIIALGGGAPSTGITPQPLAPITEPVTTSGVVQYLQTNTPPAIYSDLYNSWNVFVAFSTVVSLFAAALIIYCSIRIRQIRHMENVKFKEAAHPVKAHDLPKTQLRWNHILGLARSDSEQNWRLAILEADILLNELLDMQGYKGETMGDKMRQVERVNFNTIDLAWEAHRVRNRVAHEGIGRSLDSREARRVIELYHAIFKEFKLIT